MLHIVQVVVSGFAEIPHLCIDEVAAESAYVDGVRKYWPQQYAAYCCQNSIGQDSIASAKAFIKSFAVTEKTKVNHWVVRPEDIGLDIIRLLFLGDESIHKQRTQILSLSEDLEQKSRAIKKGLSEFLDTSADLIQNVNNLDMRFSGHQPAGDSEREPDHASPPDPQKEQAARDEKYNSTEWQQFVGTVRNMCGGSWSEFPAYNKHDWRQEVYGNLTSFEYWEWAASKIEECIEMAKSAGYAVSEDAGEPGHFRFNDPGGIGSENSYTSEFEAWCHARFHLDGLVQQ